MKIKRLQISANLNEFCFVLNLFLFALLKPLISLIPQFSTLILLLTSIAVLLLSIRNGRLYAKNMQIYIIIIGSIILWQILYMVLSYNSMQGEILYNFIIYAVIPLFLLTSVKNFYIVLKYYCVMSVLVGILYMLDPFIGYRWSNDYMQFGFSAILPAFCGTVIWVYYFHKKKMYILMAFFLAELTLCANKSSLLCAMALLLIAFIGFNYKKGIDWNRFFLLCCIFSILFIFKNVIIDIFILVANKLGFYSYSLITVKMMLSGSEGMVLDGRLPIWANALKEFMESPVFGKGAGYLESISSSTGYAHNVLLDILVSAGMLGAIIFISALIISIGKIMKCKNYDRKIFMLTLFVLWFVPMQFSLTLWKVSSFWIYWGVCFYHFSERGKQIESINSKL